MYRYLSAILFLLIFSFSCGKRENKQISIQKNDSVQFEIDSFIFEYTKQEFQLIVDSFPQLSGINGIVEHPDSAYLKYPFFVDGYTFGSEAGQDEFYLLYAHFLRKKNGDKYDKKRDNLINIYRNINDIFGELNGGGTHFGHQYIRIVGYAEYDIYNISLEGENHNVKNFQKEKQDFLKRIENDIDKTVEELHNFDIGLNKADLLQYVKELNNMLTNEFYLSKAIDFKKKHCIY